MKGDFEKFKQIIKDEEAALGPLNYSQKVRAILSSLEAVHLTSAAEARHIVNQIEEEGD